MFGGRQPVRRQRPLGKRVAGPDPGRHPQGGQLLHQGLRVDVVDRADLQVDPALAQGGPCLGVLGQHPQRDARRPAAGQCEQAGCQGRADQVGGLDGEGAPQRGGIDPAARGQQRLQPAHHRGGLVPQFLGAGCGHHRLARPYQQRVLEDPAQPGQGAAHRRGGRAQSRGGAGDALLGQQGVERDREIGVEVRILAAHRHCSVLGKDWMLKFPLWQYGRRPHDEGAPLIRPRP